MSRLLLMVILLTIGLVTKVVSQTVELEGQVFGQNDVEGIHIINKTSNRFTTTNALGRFTMAAKYQDTILVTSVQYKTVTHVVTYENIRKKNLNVYLEINVNVLDQVVVGKVLTGDLSSDVDNSDAKRDINFYDVGIPGYKGKPMTQSERRLYEADHGDYVTIGLGVGVNLNKILNRVSGRTKMLEQRVAMERQTTLISRIKDRLSADFFSQFPLEQKHRTEFFFFCSEDEEFEPRCQGKSDIEIFEYLKEKYEAYLKNLKTEKD